MILKRLLIAGCICLPLLSCTRANCGVPPGFLEGHLKIVSPKPVEVAEASPQKFTAQTYAEYPLMPLRRWPRSMLRAAGVAALFK